MHVELSTDHNIDGKERLAAHVRKVLEHDLSHFRDRITRVEVHLSDERSTKAGGRGEKRCMMEARIEKLKPIAVNDHAETVDQAVHGAAQKLKSALETILGRLGDTH